MIPSPIVKVLSTIRKHGVKALLMGGQACVFYGAAEFSRDADIVLLADAENIRRLRAALEELEATQVFVPSLDEAALQRGHGVHFRCGIPAADRVRLDVMAKLRGVAPFAELWERRTVLADEAGNEYDLLSLQDLVRAKKTQREKDWPMIARLLEANYVENKERPTPEQVRFWLREMRTPDYLMEVARKYREATSQAQKERPLLRSALDEDLQGLEDALAAEQKAEREQDRAYWQPLKQELEKLRRAAHRE